MNFEYEVKHMLSICFPVYIGVAYYSKDIMRKHYILESLSKPERRFVFRVFSHRILKAFNLK